LEQRLRQLAAQRQASEDVLARLKEQMREDAVPFSSFFAGLARQDMSGLWLSSIRIGQAGNQLELGGGVSKAELVPKFLGKLSGEPAFKGRTFQVLSLNRQEQEAFISFRLMTYAEEEQ
jgi:MSHA biogenesis protein MshI